jgi:predicted ATPase
MLSKLYLSNFQGYKGHKTIELAPLTLVFGPNSSGKSSLLRSLLLMKQSLASGESQRKDFKYGGPSVNLVGFPNVVYGHSTKESILVGCQISNARRLASVIEAGVRYEVNELGISTIWLDFFLGFKSEDKETTEKSSNLGQVSIQLQPNIGKDDQDTSELLDITENYWSAVRVDNSILLDRLYSTVARNLRDSPDSSSEGKGDSLNQLGTVHEIVERGEEFWKEVFSRISIRYLLPNERRALFSSSRRKIPEEPELQLARHLLTLLLSTGNGAISRTFDGMTHLDPLREIPARIDVGVAVATLREPSKTESSPKQVSGWIEKLTEGRFSLDSYSSQLPEARFLGDITTRLLFDNHTQTRVTFQDVGVGLSQVEPILAALEEAVLPADTNLPNPSQMRKKSRTVLIQQPELHLHPRMQSDLMDVFIEAVSSQSTEVQIIAETHSENMVLRLQKRIREGVISAEQVSVLYAEMNPDGEGNRIRKLEIDSDGQFIDSWPLSFLDIRLDDLF